MEELLLSYNEKPFVSAAVPGRARPGRRARRSDGGRDFPTELVGAASTRSARTTSGGSRSRLLIDLLKLERDPARAPELARDVAALGEDLLLAGDYESALAVDAALAGAGARDPNAVASDGQPASRSTALVNTARSTRRSSSSARWTTTTRGAVRRHLRARSGRPRPTRCGDSSKSRR